MNVTKQLYQWDTGQKLTECTGIYVDYLIGDEVYRVEITDGTCIIPDELLQTSGRYKVWECMADNTLREFAFKVLPRPIPPNYVFTPTEQLTFEGLVQKETNKFNTNAIEKLNAYNANADNRVAEFNAQTEQIQADVSELKSDLLQILNDSVDVETLRMIDTKIDMVLLNYKIERAQTDIVPYGSCIPESVDSYIISRKISGLSEKTLYLYRMVLKDFFLTVRKAPTDITTNDIRAYLYMYQSKHDISNRTLDSKRNIICGFFNWLAAEEYICKNPAVNIKPIKYERKHKKAMTQLDLEKIRAACETKREKAIVEVLYSTGCRVSELEHLNISDVNFETKEVMLFGKGSKHRVSYLNAKAEVALKEYLNERSDDNKALFVYDKKPYDRLKKPGIEQIIRKIMERTSGVTVHVTPHVFRHTTATTAIDRGMGIVDVSKLLGHSRIDTTMEYITTNSNSVKANHKNYII